jgi:drug/metabolite transporter (DMT)-like permease
MALVLNALVWGISWWPLRELQAHGLHPLWSTVLIYLLAAIGVLVWKPQSWRGVLQHRGLLLLLVASGLTNVGFNWAVTVGDVVRVVLLFYLMPAWSVLIAWVLLNEKPSTGSLLRLALALAGVVIVLKSPGSPWPVPASIADWLALMGGLCFALTKVLLRKHGQTPAESRMLAMFGGGAIMASVAAWAGMSAQIVPAPAFALAGVPAALGLCLAFLLGNMALQYGAGHADRDFVCQRLFGLAGCGRVQHPNAGRRQSDRAGRPAGRPGAGSAGQSGGTLDAGNRAGAVTAASRCARCFNRCFSRPQPNSTMNTDSQMPTNRHATGRGS